MSAGAGLKTLLAPARAELEVRKSRFIAHAFPVMSAEEALAGVEARGDPDARHNCWAFRIGQTYRFHDAGEPGGTAGKPILAAIDAMGFDRVAILVSRWFGGILLGAGGLARAYGGVAAQALRAGEAVVIEHRLAGEITLTFAELPRIKARLGDFAVHVDSEVFGGEGAALGLTVPREKAENLGAFLRDATRGRENVIWRDAAPAAPFFNKDDATHG